MLFRFLQVSSAVSSILLTLSPVTLVRKFAHDGTAGEFVPIPFTVPVMNALFGSYFGFLIANQHYFSVSVFQVVATFAFLQQYYTYTSKKLATKMQLISILLGLLLVHAIVIWIGDIDNAKTFVGYIMCVVQVLNMASPLSNMATVIRLKNSSTMSFAVAAMSLCCSTSWFFYGLLLNELAIWLPMTMGMILSVVQLSLFVIFPAKEMKMTIDTEQHPL